MYIKKPSLLLLTVIFASFMLFVCYIKQNMNIRILKRNLKLTTTISDKNNISRIENIKHNKHLRSITNIQPTQNKNEEITEKTIPPFLQVYVECNHDFVPPLQSIPSHRIQCYLPKEGYECGESRSYLEFIINNYENPLADTYIFMHGHNTAWHYINPKAQTMQKLLNSNYIKEQNYGGYQCYWNHKPTILFELELLKLFSFLYKNTTVKIENYNTWSYPCCGTFFIHSSQIKQRPKSEYLQMIQNLKEWSENIGLQSLFGTHYDGVCGRVYEMMWNRILSNTTMVKLPPYCRTEEILKTNGALSVNEYKRWRGN